jgi:DNA/RNA-binding domain of Phe-tRNA-synthetase-like protein
LTAAPEIALERPAAAVTRFAALIAEDVDLDRQVPALRAALSRAAATLRRAFADLDAGSVPGVLECRALLDLLGADAAQRRAAPDAAVARALRGQAAKDLSPSRLLEQALALEFLTPLAVASHDAVRGDLVVRLGRDDERIEEHDDPQAAAAGRAEWLPLRSRVALFDAAGPLLAPGVVAERARPLAATRSLLIALFLPRGLAVEEVERRADACGRRIETLLLAKITAVAVPSPPTR